MKTLAYVLIVVVSIFCLTGMVCSKAEATAPDYWGEFCWQLHVTQNNKGPQDITALVKLAVTYTGGTYYTVQGLIVAPDEPLMISGAGQIVGDEVIVTLYSSQQHSSPWRDSGVGQMRLNLSNLDGTFWSNYMSFNAATGEYGQGGFGIGTVTYTSCP